MSLETDPDFLEAVDELDAGRAHEAHALLEKALDRTSDRASADLLDALLLVTGGVPRLQSRVGVAGVRRGLTRALELLVHVPEGHATVEVARLRRGIEAARDATLGPDEGASASMPELRLRGRAKRAPKGAPDPLDRYRGEVRRLSAIGVSLVELPPSARARLEASFAATFVDPFELEQLRQREGAGATLSIERFLADVERWSPPTSARRLRSAEAFRWLVERGRRVVFRLDPRAAVPAVEIAIGALHESWASSWPAVYVDLDAVRAVAVTHDYACFACAPLTPRASAYR